MGRLEEKTEKYERLLAAAIEAASVPAGADDERAAGAETCLTMATAYLKDGRRFRAEDTPVEALAAFSYGHGWLDAGARLGVLAVPAEGDLFTV